MPFDSKSMIWYLEGDENVVSIVNRVSYQWLTTEEVERVDRKFRGDEDGAPLHTLYRLRREILDKVIESINFVNFRLPPERQIKYTFYYDEGEGIQKLWDLPIIPPFVPNLLAS